MTESKNIARNQSHSSDFAGNPIVVLDEILGCCQQLFALLDKGNTKNDVSHLFHFFNQKYLEDKLVGSSDKTPDPLGEDWEKLRDIYGEEDGSEEEFEFRRIRGYVSELGGIALRNQTSLIKFVVQSFSGDLLSKRSQLAVLHFGAKFLPVSDVDFLVDFFTRKSEQSLSSSSRDKRSVQIALKTDPEIVLEALQPRVNFLELAVDFISEMELDMENDDGGLSAISFFCEDFRKFILKIAPKSLVNELSEEEQDLVNSCEALREKVQKDFFDFGGEELVGSSEIETLIRNSKLSTGESLFDSILKLDFQSQTIASQIKPSLSELKVAYSSNMSSAVVFLCGNLVENLLMELMEQNRAKVEEIISEKNLDFTKANSYVKMDDFSTWRFVFLLKLVKYMYFQTFPEFYNILEAFRQVRNYIHGGKDPIQNMHADLGLSALAVCEKIISKGK